MVVWHGMLSWLRIFGVPGRSLAPALASRTAAEKQDALDVVGLLHFAERAKRARPEPAFILSADAFLPVASRASAAGDALPEFQTIPGRVKYQGWGDGSVLTWQNNFEPNAFLASPLRCCAPRRHGLLSPRSGTGPGGARCHPRCRRFFAPGKGHTHCQYSKQGESVGISTQPAIVQNKNS